MLDDSMTELQTRSLARIQAANTPEELEAVRVDALGRKAGLTQFSKEMGKLAPDERARIGKLLNSARQQLEDALEAKKQRFAEAALAARLDAEWVDLTLPAPGPRRGHLHPITRIQRELEDLFVSLGFAVLDGPEVETEYHNFDALNIPPDHPARDMQDTFWLDGGNLLRTHTSPVQVRGMERLGPPLRMIAPGRVFRNESVDASHEHTFYQLEGMMIDRDVSVAHLLYFMKTLLTAIFQRDVTVRLRPGLLPVRRTGLRARYSVPDLRRPRLPGLQTERLGGTAALRPGESERAAHERHRSRGVERLRLRPGPDAPGHDALRHRRHPPAAGRRSEVPGAVLTAPQSDAVSPRHA